jgi:hypothetical protein
VFYGGSHFQAADGVPSSCGLAIGARSARMLKSLTSCMRKQDGGADRQGPVAKILLTTGGATASARDSTASFFSFRFVMIASSGLRMSIVCYRARNESVFPRPCAPIAAAFFWPGNCRKKSFIT